MTVAFAEKSETVDTNNVTSYATNSYTPVTNALLIASIYCPGTTAADATFVGNGLTWTSEVQLNTGTGQRLYVFSALTGSSPSAGVGTFDCTSDAATGACIHIAEFTNVNLADGTVQAKAATVANGATPAVTFDAPVTAGNGVLAIVGNNLNPAAITEPSGYIETMDNGFNTPSAGLEVAYHLNPGAISTVTWGSTSGAVGAAALVEIKAAVQGKPIFVNSLGSV